MRRSEEIPYIWDLIFQASPPEVLKIACEVCKLFNDLATPLLYRSAILRKSQTTGAYWDALPIDFEEKDPAKAKEVGYSLFNRLRGDQKMRSRIRELILTKIEHDGGLWFVRNSCQFDRLASLVEDMPNLSNVYFEDDFPVSTGILRALSEHKKSPKLHLLNRDYDTESSRFRSFRGHSFRGHLFRNHSFRGRSISPEPSGIQKSIVRTLHIKVPHLDHYPETRKGHDSILREVLSAYPDLEDLRIWAIPYQRTGVTGPDGLPVLRNILNFVSPENTSKVPGPGLFLNGYVLWHDISFWREQFPWHKLRSLSLGPHDSPRFLESVGSCVQNLTSFTITQFCKQTAMAHAGLDSFLSSFNTLEELTAKGYVPSVQAVAHHPRLKHLCLHAIEYPDRERPTLSSAEIELLDQSCPHLNSLDIDINPDGIWPVPIIDSLATRFRNIRQLSIHVELGIRRMELEWELKFQLGRQLNRQTRQRLRGQFDDDSEDSDDSMGEMSDADTQDYNDCRYAWNASVLTRSKAQDFGERFFGRRQEPSNLQKITLRTGETLRQFRGQRPDYALDEDHHQRVFEIYAPSNKTVGSVVKELETMSSNV